MSTLSRTTNSDGRGQSIWVAGLLAVVGSVIANWITLAVILAVTDLTTDFISLNYAPIGIFTTVGIVAATVVYYFVIHRAGKSIRTYWIIAMVAMVVSSIPNVIFAINPSAAPFPGATGTGFVALIVFHVVAALVSTVILTRTAPPRR
jgi:hypothetical protein